MKLTDVESELTASRGIVHNGGMAENLVDQNSLPRLNRRKIVAGAAAGAGVVALVAAGVALAARPSREQPAGEPKDPLTKWTVQKRVIPEGGGIINLANRVYGVQPMDTYLVKQRIYRASGFKKDYQEVHRGVEIVIPSLDPQVDTVGVRLNGHVPGLDWQLEEVKKDQPKFRFVDRNGSSVWFEDGAVFRSGNGQQFRFTLLRDDSELGMSGNRVSVETVRTTPKK